MMAAAAAAAKGIGRQLTILQTAGEGDKCEASVHPQDGRHDADCDRRELWPPKI